MLAVYARFLVANQYAHKAVDLKVDLTSIKRMIGQNIDCEQSLPKQATKSCSGRAKHISLKSQNGKILVQNQGRNGVKFGEWLVRSRCSTDQERIIVEYKPEKANRSVTRYGTHF